MANVCLLVGCSRCEGGVEAAFTAVSLVLSAVSCLARGHIWNVSITVKDLPQRAVLNTVKYI